MYFLNRLNCTPCLLSVSSSTPASSSRPQRSVVCLSEPPSDFLATLWLILSTPTPNHNHKPYSHAKLKLQKSMHSSSKQSPSLIDKELHRYGGDCSEEDNESDQDCSGDANKAMPKPAAIVDICLVWVEKECAELSIQSLALLARKIGE